VGPTGSGKSAQIWTLPGRKFLYVFDPNTMPTIRGCDVDYEEFFPDFAEMDATLKGFNKGSKSDRPKKPKEPTVYTDWVENINAKVDAGFFRDYDWVILDSVTFLSKATMDRQLYLNGRYGDLEDRADYRVVGSKLSDLFNTLSGLPINVYCTGHTRTFEDDKTKKVTTQINLPGKARDILPLMFTNVWLAKTKEDDDGQLRYFIRTKPEPRGFQDIRSCIQNLAIEEDVTIPNFEKMVPGKMGIGGLLAKFEAAKKENVYALHKDGPR
jgi:AAA domain